MAMEKAPTRIEKNNISIVTNSDNYYQYMTSLIHQIIFLMGQKTAILSAMNSNGNFEDDLYNTFEENTNKILKNFDVLLEENSKEIKDEEKMIDVYFQTQELIYKTYFTKIYKLLITKDEVDNVVQKLFDYENIIGTVLEEQNENSDGKNLRSQFNTNFKNFSEEMDEKFYKKYLEIDARTVRNLPAVRKRSFIANIIEKIKNYFKNKIETNM